MIIPMLSSTASTSLEFTMPCCSALFSESSVNLCFLLHRSARSSCCRSARRLAARTGDANEGLLARQISDVLQ